MALKDYAPALIQGVAGIGGSLIDMFSGEDQADKAADFQKDFAKKGIRWRVADAKKAGIHPLFALGANTVSFTPSYVGGDDRWQRTGQDIGQAIGMIQTKEEKTLALLRIAQEREKLKNMKLENIGLQNQVQQILHRPTEPGTKTDHLGIVSQDLPPDVGQGWSYQPNLLPMSESAGVKAGISPGENRYLHPGGWLESVPDERLGESRESGGAYYGVRGFLYSLFQHIKSVSINLPWNKKLVPDSYNQWLAEINAKRPRQAPPKGHVWKFNLWLNDWYAVKK